MPIAMKNPFSRRIGDSPLREGALRSLLAIRNVTG
jgi:hypothetical protein